MCVCVRGRQPWWLRCLATYIAVFFAAVCPYIEAVAVAGWRLMRYHMALTMRWSRAIVGTLHGVCLPVGGCVCVLKLVV